MSTRSCGASTSSEDVQAGVGEPYATTDVASDVNAPNRDDGAGLLQAPSVERTWYDVAGVEGRRDSGDD